MTVKGGGLSFMCPVGGGGLSSPGGGHAEVPCHLSLH